MKPLSWHFSSDTELLEKLENKVIQKVEISEENEVLKFTFEDSSEVMLTTYGECCSMSWIEHLEGVAHLVGSKITSICSITLEETQDSFRESDREKQSHVLLFYSTKFKLEKPFGYGEFQIEYRNDSNGYYGGALEIVTASGLTEDIKFKPLLEDF